MNWECVIDSVAVNDELFFRSIEHTYSVCLDLVVIGR